MPIASHSKAELSVQLASPADVAVLVELMHEFYAESSYELDRQWAARSFASLLSDSSLGCVWLGKVGLIPAGHIVLTLRHAMEHGRLVGYIDDLYVKPAFRRQGVGSELLGALRAECIARMVGSLSVEVSDSNAPALALYAKFGLSPAADGRVLLSGGLQMQAPNPSIERTVTSGLRPLVTAAHVKR